MMPDQVFASDEVAALRSELPTVHGRAYLNAGTLGPMPADTIEAMHAELSREASNRYPSDIWEHLGACQTSARTQLGRLVGAPVDHVALMHTTHEGISTCLWGLDLREGDEIVTTSEEHPGVLVPLRIMRDRRGIRIRCVPWDDNPATLAAHCAAAISSRTRAVIVSHVSWVSGGIANLRMIREAIGPDVMFIVDGAQGAGAIPVDMQHDSWDAYTVSGQKWSLGPNGSGCLALREPDRWQPVMGGFFVTDDPPNSLNAQISRTGTRFEFSQENTIPLVGIVHSLEFLLERVGVDRAEVHSKYLNRITRSAIGPGIEALNATASDTQPMRGSGHLLVAPVAPGTAPSITSQLAQHNVDVRYLDDDHIRISLGFWTTTDDIDALASQLINVASAGPTT